MNIDGELRRRCNFMRLRQDSFCVATPLGHPLAGRAGARYSPNQAAVRARTPGAMSSSAMAENPTSTQPAGAADARAQ